MTQLKHFLESKKCTFLDSPAAQLAARQDKTGRITALLGARRSQSRLSSVPVAPLFGAASGVYGRPSFSVDVKTDGTFMV